MSLFFVADKVAHVLAIVAICELPLPMHLVVSEFADEVTPIGPGILPLALHQVLRKLTLVARPVEHDEIAVAVPVAVFVLAFKAAVVPDFNAAAVLLVVGPEAVVAGFIAPHQLAQSAPLVVLELTNIVAAIRVNHATLSVMFINRPVAIVASPVRPELKPSPVPLRTTPLARIFDHRFVQVSHLRLRARHHLLIKFLQHFFALLIAELEWPDPLDYLVHGL